MAAWQKSSEHCHSCLWRRSAGRCQDRAHGNRDADLRRPRRARRDRPLRSAAQRPRLGGPHRRQADGRGARRAAARSASSPTTPWREVDRARPRPRPRRRRQPAAAGRRGAARVAARGRPRDQVDDLGLHRLAGARRRRPAARASGRPRNWLVLDAAARATAPTRSAAASSRTARWSPPPASPPASTWPCTWSPREVGPEVAQAVQLGIEYDPDPPFDSGSPEKAPPEIVELVRRVATPAS